MGDVGTWHTLRAPESVEPPQPLHLRIQSMPPRHFFPQHAHRWNQLVYAVSGVLTVNVEGRCFVIPPDHAVWVPTGVPHRVGSLHGSEFRSLYVADKPDPGVARACTVFSVPPLLRILIIEAATLSPDGGDPYADRVKGLILDQLCRLHPVPFSLPWPSGSRLLRLCSALFDNPCDLRDIEDWGRELGMSSRTLSRRFHLELGISLRDWRRQLRLLKAVELLDGGTSVTETAFSLGYSSASAFTYMFRTEMGCSPRAYQRRAAVR